MANYDNNFVEDGVTKLSILDILEGPGNLRHQTIHLFTVLMSLCDLLLLYNPPGMHWGTWVLVLPIHPGSTFVLCEVEQGPHSSHWVSRGGISAALPLEENVAG